MTWHDVMLSTSGVEKREQNQDMASREFLK